MWTRSWPFLGYNSPPPKLPQNSNFLFPFPPKSKNSLCSLTPPIKCNTIVEGEWTSLVSHVDYSYTGTYLTVTPNLRHQYSCPGPRFPFVQASCPKSHWLQLPGPNCTHLPASARPPPSKFINIPAHNIHRQFWHDHLFIYKSTRGPRCHFWFQPPSPLFFLFPLPTPTY